MRRVIIIANGLARMVDGIGRVAAWFAIPLVVVTIFDVVTRRFFNLGSTMLQEMEWHFHTLLFCFCLGFAYLRDSHIRIDLVRDRVTSRTKAWIELIGGMLFLLPYCAIIIYYGWTFVYFSFKQNEGSSALTGLPFRWAIKAVILVGLALVIIAGVSIIIRKAIFLFGTDEHRKMLARHPMKLPGNEPGT
jgi:TRAP-type mannitol/chloroaromatic compound transport system permease small subunit